VIPPLEHRTARDPYGTTTGLTGDAACLSGTVRNPAAARQVFSPGEDVAESSGASGEGGGTADPSDSPATR
jgi:hypothetical protein